MPGKAFTLSLFSLVALAILGLSLFPVGPILADGPPPDYACRGCHSDNQRQLTLPSGETLSLLVSPDDLATSPHHAAAAEAVLCTACHRTETRYQYPHRPNPAQTLQDFRREVSDNCRDCHVSHSPLHSVDQPNPDFPGCVDCHGSHQIDYTEDIIDNMPSACLACHSEQTPAWAIDLIPDRPGWGEAAAGYIGSDRCAGCHEARYFSWRGTLHARMIQNPAADPMAIVGDFSVDDPDLTFELSDVAYTIGSRWKQRYLTQDEKGDFYILPAQWNVESGEWVPYNPDTWQDTEWRQACGSCHVTGLDTETWGFSEFGIGCESCHGPGAEHAAAPKAVKPFTEIDDQVCGACHSRGTSPDGLVFPASYRPGDTLTDHFTFTTAEADIWPDGSAKKHRQQYMDWQLGSNMALSVDTNCVTCHAVHDSGIGRAQLVAPMNDLCLQCHNKKAIVQHIPFHNRASEKRDFLCSDCHLPKTATSAVPNDIHNHSFLQPNPQASIDHGGVEFMINACNTCHTDFGEDEQWAADTIAYIKAIATPAPVSVSIFGPGPTPTSPPPPTAIPSVGQKADIEQYQVATGRSLRTAFFVILGLVAIGIIYLVYRSIKSWRLKHV